MTRTVLRGGYVHTPASPHATALCVEDGQVVWAGDDDAAAHFLDNADRVVDLDGRLVTPAFVDSHVHLAQTGLAMAGVDLTTAQTRGAALDAVAAAASRTDVPIVLGFGWDETGWPDGRAFTREELDRAAGSRPTYLARVDEHSAAVNTAFLEAGDGIADADGFDPSGLVAREAHHRARDTVFRIVPRSAREEAIRQALHLAARQGFGMVHELGAPSLSLPDDLTTCREVAAQAAVPEVVGYWGELDGVEAARELGCAGAAGDLCVDGSIGSRTSAVHLPYADADSVGHLYLDAEQVARHVVACTRAGLQAGFHVIGDRGVAEVVAGFCRAAEELGTAAVVAGRHRLEHLEMVDAQQMGVLAELGVTASVQPMFDQLWGGPDSLYAQRLGSDRALPMNPYASLGRSGIALAFGSDTPVTPFDPWGAVRAAAWHQNPDERITARAAFTAHTRGGWRAAGRDEGGVLAPGAPACLAVWDVPGHLVVQTPDPRVAAWSTDPRAGVPHLPDLHPDLDLPSCVLTMVHGEVAFEETGALS
ncbi:MAG TPA: amidohydrolase family protein [Nocardioidaceae bacterium]|nr:amidohydrolase family protein [Nocardioidaceae bacterium]